MKYPAYPNYKDSGVDWLGDIPAHWQVSRLRYVVQLNPSKQEIRGLPRNQDISFLPMESIGDDGKLDLERVRQIADVETGYTFFRDGDVTVAKITPCFENGKGALMEGLVNGYGFGTTELTVLRAKEGQEPEFIYLITKISDFRKLGEASMYGAGGQKRVPDEFFRDFRLALPPPKEQKVIINFVKRETTRIDALIRKQERLIELLQEKRQALISNTVTKGLNPDVPMKDSGIEWLGKIPSHWSVIHLKRTFTSVKYGFSESLKPVGEIAVLRMGNIQDGEIIMDDIGYVDSVESELYLQENDLLFNRTNSLELIGKVGIFRGSAFDLVSFASYLVRFRTKDHINPQYLCYLLNRREVLERARSLALPSISQANLNPNRYGYIKVCVPPLDEQRVIVRFIQVQTEWIQILIEKAKQTIELLKEHRAALISAAVTGKIDVREYATRGAAV